MLAAVVVSGCGGDVPRAPATGNFTLEPVATFDAVVGEGALSSPPLITPVLGGTHRVVTTPWGGGERRPRLFDLGGKYLTTLGREGAGPREFQAAELVHATGDTAMIHDIALRRMTFVAPPDSFLRTVVWPHRPYSLHELADGTFVVSTGDFSAGPPMMHLSRTGDLLAEFGEYAAEANQESRHRLFAAAADGGFWSARPWHKYEVQRWRSPGDLVETIRLTASWFPDYGLPQRPSRMTPPSPFLVAMWSDAEGMLWMVGGAPDERWFEGVSAPETLPDGREFARIDDPDRVFDTMIERWDPRTNTRLFSERLDTFYSISPEPWVLGSVRDDGMAGYKLVTLWRVAGRR